MIVAHLFWHSTLVCEMSCDVNQRVDKLCTCTKKLGVSEQIYWKIVADAEQTWWALTLSKFSKMKNCTKNMFDIYRKNNSKRRRISRTPETSKVVLSGTIVKAPSHNQ